MQQNNQDFKSTWMNYYKRDFAEFYCDRLEGEGYESVAEYFFNAGIASTKRKPQQVPVLFKPKD